MKKITILKHGGGELANQLWNYTAIYAYGLEKGTRVTNPSFFEYHNHFRLLSEEGIITRIFSAMFWGGPGRRADKRHRFFRTLYGVYARILTSLHKTEIVSSENTVGKVTYLFPSEHNDPLAHLDHVYFTGWLFRNPAGLQKHRKEIISAFRPSVAIEEKIISIITPFREKYKNVIGIHLRQSDYKVFKGGAYLIEQSRARRIVDEYLEKNSLTPSETLFIIASDGAVDENIWQGLQVYTSRESSVVDLFLLSAMDAVIGSDSSFGAFGAWYGNIPHIVMTKEPMDWTYYADKKVYFENKYSKMVQY